MPYICTTSGAVWVSSLAKRTSFDISLAALANSGAICLHGPHQSAQKSTSTGNCDLATVRLKVAADRSTGSSGNKGTWHLPQLAFDLFLSVGTRLMAAQDGQTSWVASLINNSFAMAQDLASCIDLSLFPRDICSTGQVLKRRMRKSARPRIMSRPGVLFSAEYRLFKRSVSRKGLCL